MDRRIRTSAVFATAILVLGGTGGCRSTRDEVPPGRRNRRAEPGAPAVEFSTEPRPGADLAGAGPLGGAAGNVGPGTLGSGGGLPPYGAPTGSGFGPPGTAGAVAGSDTPGHLLGTERPGAATRDPAVGTSVFGKSSAGSGTAPPFDPSAGLPPGVP